VKTSYKEGSIVLLSKIVVEDGLIKIYVRY